MAEEQAIMAEEPHITMFNELHLSINDFVIKARIIRIWRTPSWRDLNQDYALEMLLLDENGDKIQANILNRLVPMFETFLRENATLIIKWPQLGRNASRFKYCESPFKVFFTRRTSLLNCDDFVGNDQGFRFVPFFAFLQNEVQYHISVDVIGHIKKFITNDDGEKKYVDNKQMITMQIEDLQGIVIDVILFDQYADQLSKFIAENPTDVHMVILLQFAFLKIFKGKPYVMSSPSMVTRLYINEDVEPVNTYKISLSERAVDNPTLNLQPYGVSMFWSLEYDFLTNSDFTLIGDIWEIMKEKHVVVLGTVKLIYNHVGWYYMACPTCKVKVDTDYITRIKQDGSGDFEDVDVHQCKNVNCFEDKVVALPRYDIKLEVEDNTGSVSLTLSHHIATKLIKKSATQLIAENTVHGHTFTYPIDISSLVGRIFAFKIHVTENDIQSIDEVYAATKITDDESIISELKKHQKNGQDFFDLGETSNNTKEIVDCNDVGSKEGVVSKSDLD